MSVWCGSVLAGAENTCQRTVSDSRSKVGFFTALCREYRGIQDPSRGIPGGRSLTVFSAPGSFFTPGTRRGGIVSISTALKRRRQREKTTVFSDCGFGVPENVGFMCALPKVVA